MTAARSTQSSPCPKALGDVVDHFWLVQRMAKTAEVDLAEAMHSGDLSHEEWYAMINRCRGCAWAEGCGRWLNQQTTAVETPPEPCLNRGLMTALKAG